MENNNILQPTKSVLNAFSINDKPILIEGGQGTSYLCGKTIIKPEEDIEESSWTSEILSKIKVDGIRFPKPINAINGEWVYEGWSAHNFVEGKETKSRWKEKIEISRKLHSAIKDIEKPNFIGNRTHPWEISDKMVWEQTKLEYGNELKPVISRLEKHLEPIQIEEQIIHGDLTGNILFHPKLAPAIIDFSPYWRPAEYATAIIIVDSIVWENSPDALINEMDNNFESNQLLIRAAMWRIKTIEEFIKQYGKGNINEVESYHHFIDILLERISEI